MPLSLVPRTRIRILLFTLICAVSLALVFVLTKQSVSAAGNTITVNSTSDAASNADGLCTLREAVIAANTNTASGAVAGECAAGSIDGSDTIDLTGLTGSITITSALPFISSDATLNGPGPGTLAVQRITDGNFGIFTSSNNASVNISGLAFQGGNPLSNAGIVNIGNATLTVSNCTVTGFGRGIMNSSQRALTVSNCTISGNLNGGGVSNGSGTLNVHNSTITGNDSRGGFGPGIDNSFGILNVSNTTVSSNSGHIAIMNGSSAIATFINVTVSNNNNGGFINNGTLTMTGGAITGNVNGGGLITAHIAVIDGVTVSNNANTSGVFFGGGGLFLGGTSSIVKNCLVTNNTANGPGGGIHNAGGKAIVISTTVFNNTSFFRGGGVASSGNASDFFGVNLTIRGNRSNLGGGASREFTPLKFKNSIIAGNFLIDGTTPSDIAEPVVASSSHNIIGTGGSGGLTNGVNNNQVGVADPRLGPLANNGGPTQTFSLLTDSPALDAGDNCVTEVTHCGEPDLPQVTTDQRRLGFSRIADGPDANATAAVDIGAYEIQAPLAGLANTTTNEDTQAANGFDAGDTSTITSITATSSNTTLVPNDPANLTAVIAGTSGVITMNPVANLSGTTDVTVTVNRTGGPEVKVFTLTVNPVNDIPSFTKGPDQSVLEDAGAQTITNWATNVSTGPPNESGQTLSFQILNNTNVNLFSAGPAISSTGALTYTPAPNVSGTATITIVGKDNGGTANGGVDTTPSQSFVITVAPVNDAPTFTKGPDVTVNEDAGIVSIFWASNVSAGPNEFQNLTFEITQNTNPGLFALGPDIGSSGTLFFMSAPNLFGSATISVRLRDSGGTANGGVDVTGIQTFTITVNSNNDRPAFTRGPNQVVIEDAGAQSIANWATNISPGPADEAGQVITTSTTNNNNALFLAQPAVSSTGTLTYTPAANAVGSAIVSVTFKDDGGTANGGQDTFTQLFSITVTAVNDAPVNIVPGAQAVVKNNPLIFSATETNQISIADIDAGNGTLEVTLSSAIGVFTLSGTTGLNFSVGTGSNNSTMTFTGTISNINAALNGMSFLPTNNFEGSGQIQITTSDNGNSGSGGALSDSDIVSINVVQSTVQFSASAYAVVEGSEQVTITVTRVGGSGAASVNYSTASGTASGGGACGGVVDYVNQSGTLSWTAGDTNAKTFTIPVCEDAVNESDETVNLTLTGETGDTSLGAKRTAVLTIVNAGAPVLLSEENTEHAIAIDAVTATRDPFSLTYPFTFSADNRRRISLFVWRLAIKPSDTTSNLTVTAEDTEGRIYPLTVEFVGTVTGPPAVNQVVVRLPDGVVGAPRDLFVTVQLRTATTNRAFIRIAAP